VRFLSPSKSPSLSVPPARPALAQGEPDDIELARRIAASDQAAFVILMRRHNRMLYRAARSILLKDEREAEDAVQETYLLAYRTIAQFRGEAKLSTWLVRIVVNEAIARLRRQRRSAAIAARLDGDADLNEAAPEPPEQGAQRSEARRILQARIDALPDALRIVFVLRALEEMSVEDVAAALDISKVTVRTRFFRAKHRLRAALSRQVETPFPDGFPFAGERCNGIVAAVLARLKRESPLRMPS
jgi:RNA polymerase sigma-70 factor, ECF subfamily